MVSLSVLLVVTGENEAVEKSVLKPVHLRPVAENPNVTSMSLAYLGRMGLGQSLPALEQA